MRAALAGPVLKKVAMPVVPTCKGGKCGGSKSLCAWHGSKRCDHGGGACAFWEFEAWTWLGKTKLRALQATAECGRLPDLESLIEVVQKRRRILLHLLQLPLPHRLELRDCRCVEAISHQPKHLGSCILVLDAPQEIFSNLPPITFRIKSKARIWPGKVQRLWRGGRGCAMTGLRSIKTKTSVCFVLSPHCEIAPCLASTLCHLRHRISMCWGIHSQTSILFRAAHLACFHLTRRRFSKQSFVISAFRNAETLARLLVSNRHHSSHHLLTTGRVDF
jgi:hypothetical protein